MAIIMVIGGLILLPLTADWLVRGATGLARHFGIPDVLIGLTVVAIGTSAPELVTGILAAVQNAPGIALGNAVGSNIANLGLVLGAIALVGRIPVQQQLLGRDVPVMLGVMLVSLLMALDGVISRLDGLVLVLILGALTWWTIRRDKLKPPQELAPAEPQPAEPQLASQTKLGWQSIVALIAGVIGLAAGAELLVRGATLLAAAFGVSNTVIGATVVALGTSLPELAASFAAARQKLYGLMLGNLVGSCQFNLAAIVGIPALIRPLNADHTMLSLHIPAMMVMALAAWIMLSSYKTVLRREGFILVVMYGVYIALTIYLA
ncbi:calcium/sodium antiporter [bacterium]|nr:calcium/sodium antiporter [bacterium]